MVGFFASIQIQLFPFLNGFFFCFILDSFSLFVSALFVSICFYSVLINIYPLPIGHFDPLLVISIVYVHWSFRSSMLVGHFDSIFYISHLTHFDHFRSLVILIHFVSKFQIVKFSDSGKFLLLSMKIFKFHFQAINISTLLFQIATDFSRFRLTSFTLFLF